MDRTRVPLPLTQIPPVTRCLSPSIVSGLYLPSTAAFIDEGHLARHIRKMRGVYRRRHDLITEAIAGPLSQHLTPFPSAAGLHVSAAARTASVAEMTRVAGRALAAGVAVQPLSTFRITQPALAGLALGYGAIEAGDIGAGLLRLGQSFSPG